MADVIIGTRKMIVKLGVAPAAATDVSDEVATAIITADKTDSDFQSFADALNGGARDYKLKMKIRQNTDTQSVWYMIWNNAGDDATVELWPNGGTTEGATTPKITGTAVITEPSGDLLGTESNPSPTKVGVVEVEWPFTAKPTIDITP